MKTFSEEQIRNLVLVISSFKLDKVQISLEPENSLIPQQATSEACKGGKIVLKERKQFLTLASIGWISELLRNSRRSSLQ